jgi:hypothetical protein
METSECEVIPITISPVIKEGALPCPTYISITSQKHEKIDYIIFQNYYVTSVSILQLNRDSRWVPILTDFRLTNFPHFENDAENFYIIPSTFFNDNFVPNYFKEVRIYLVQPSPNWKKFELRGIVFYTIREKPPLKKNEPTSAFSRLKAQIQEKVEVLNSTTGLDIVSYEETLGAIEVTKLEVTQVQ